MVPERISRRARLLGAVLDAWAVVLPIECSGCGAPDRSLCPACRAALRASVHPCRREGVPVWSGLDYAGVARRVIGAYKDGGRTDAASALAVPLRAAVAAALAAAPPGRPADAGPVASPQRTVAGVHLVTVPSSRRAWRSRGYHPVELLLRRGGLAPTRVLRQVGEAVDQVGLGRVARGRNKHGSLRAVRRLDGFRCVIVDDILTTGATILEARRAVLEAGGEVIGLAALAETRLHRSDSSRSRETD